MQTGRIKLLLVSPVLMWVIVAAGVVLAFTFAPDMYMFRRTALSIAFFALTALNWFYFLGGVIERNPAAPRSAAGISNLATEGVYARVRHPIYAADMLLAVGAFTILPTLKALISLAWLILVLLVWMKLEEAAMLARFGDEYAKYKARTPMVIPRIKRGHR